MVWSYACLSSGRTNKHDLCFHDVAAQHKWTFQGIQEICTRIGFLLKNLLGKLFIFIQEACMFFIQRLLSPLLVQEAINRFERKNMQPCLDHLVNKHARRGESDEPNFSTIGYIR